MMTSNLQEPVKKLDTFISPHATFAIKFDRNEDDEYDFKVIGLLGAEQLGVTKQDIYGLIPSDSQWLHLIGWHSYVGIPFPVNSPNVLIIGVEVVVPHPRRGAFITFYGYGFPFPTSIQLLGELQNWANAIDPDTRGKDKFRFSHGIIRTNSENAEQHTSIESGIIRAAVDAYQQNIPLSFRTLVMQESQLVLSTSPHVLQATVHKVEEYFSRNTQFKLFLHRLPGFD